MQTEHINPNEYSPLALAFLGDAVYELCARYAVMTQGNAPVGKMNHKKVELVSAAAQAAFFTKIQPVLTEQEQNIFKRGRNANPSSTPKNADVGSYHYATGLEALFGYLFLQGRYERIGKLFELGTKAEDEGRQNDG